VDTERSTQLALTTDWQEITRLVLRSRLLDELEEAELAPPGTIPYQFSAKGHELVQTLVGLALDHPHDAATVYYRSRPFALAVGLSLEEALRAGMALPGSPSEGRDAGVMFNLPPRHGPTILPSSGDVGAQFTPAAGWAQACRYRAESLGEADWEGAIAVALGGDGSVASNGFWSALTIATTQRLPLLLVIENNGYGLSVPNAYNTPGGDIAENLAAFRGLLTLSGSGTDPREAALLVQRAVAHVRSGEGPALLHLRVPRLTGHTFIDNQAYRSPAELQSERERDPLVALRAELGEADFQGLARQAEAEVRQALASAREAPAAGGSIPAPDPASARRHVRFEGELQQVGGISPERGRRPEPPSGPAQRAEAQPAPAPGQGPRLNLIDAVRQVLEQELEDNPRAVLFGEDVGAKGGVHGATLGLQSRFGDSRVFDTSLSEEGIIGRALGMAFAGLLPLPEIQFRKYADPAYEQLRDCGWVRWRTAGKFAAPMVVRIPVGHGKKVGDPWHSLSDEASLARLVGWRIAYPSNAADAGGLLRTALAGEDPTFFLEHRALLDAPLARRPDPGPSFQLPFGQAAALTPGSDITLVTWGAMVYPALQAAARFPGRVEVLDLRTIVPWDLERVLTSVRRTGRCLVVHEDTLTGGFGAEILACVSSQAFESLDAPPRRLAAADCPVPYSTELLGAVLPGAEGITQAIADLLAF
jgi:2-oxoisovalerate dehydrogenase E1 component